MFSFLLPMIHLFVCMYVHNFPCDYFSPFYVVIGLCFGKQTRNNTIRVLPYICVQRFFSTSVAAIELFTFFFFFFFFFIIFSLKQPINVHCDWRVSSSSFSSFFFSRSLSCCCLMMFYVCKYVRVCGILS